ncbi:MAG: S8/S53 family peptidase [Saprospiraceae bacterium]
MKLRSLIFSMLCLLTWSISAQNIADFHAGFIVRIADNQPDESLEGLVQSLSDVTVVEGNPLWATQQIAILTFSPDHSAAEIASMEERLQSAASVDLVNKFYFKDGKIGGLLPEFYVQLKQPSDLSKLQALATLHQTPILRNSKYNANLYTLSTSKSTKDSKAMAAIFRATDQFELTGYNSMFSFNQHTNDPYYATQWAINNDGVNSGPGGTVDADMDVDDAWSYTQGSASIKIGLMDSGVDTLHPDLIPNLITGFDALGEGTKGYPALVYNDDAHGTACAGIISAVADNETVISGIAPNCSLVPIRIYKTIEVLGGATFFSTAEAAIAAFNYALLEAKVDVISASVGLNDLTLLLGQLDTDIVESAIESALPQSREGKGTVVFFSAGNDNTSTVAWPARHPAIIAVGASNMCDEKKDFDDCSEENWWGGDFGENLSISAPGVKISTIDMLPPYGYDVTTNFTVDFFNGTSAACPNAAGIAALMLSYNENMTGENVRFLLENSCEKVGGYDYGTARPSGSWSSEMGYGRVNANEAMKLVENFVVNTTEIEKIGQSFSIFPNPTSGQVLIEFELAKSQAVEVSIVNHLGQNVRNVMPQSLAAGKQQVVWNGQDQGGAAISNGIYFAIIKIGTEQIAQKIIVQR